MIREIKYLTRDGLYSAEYLDALGTRGWGNTKSEAAVDLQLVTLRAENAKLRDLAYHTDPGEYSPDGWTWKQQANADRARLAEAEAYIQRLRDAAKRVLSGTGDRLDAMCILERTVYGGRSDK